MQQSVVGARRRWDWADRVSHCCLDLDLVVSSSLAAVHRRRVATTTSYRKSRTNLLAADWSFVPPQVDLNHRVALTWTQGRWSHRVAGGDDLGWREDQWRCRPRTGAAGAVAMRWLLGYEPLHLLLFTTEINTNKIKQTKNTKNRSKTAKICWPNCLPKAVQPRP